MPQQTPGPSRRFRPPASFTSVQDGDENLPSRSATRPSFKLTPSSQSVGSTQAPKFRPLPSQPIDDIETSFGDDQPSPPPGERSKQKSVANRSGHTDELKSDGEAEEVVERPSSGHRESEEHHARFLFTKPPAGLGRRFTSSETLEEESSVLQTPRSKKRRKSFQSDPLIDEDSTESASTPAGQETSPSNRTWSYAQRGQPLDHEALDNEAPLNSEDENDDDNSFPALPTLPISPVCSVRTTKSRFRPPTSTGNVLRPPIFKPQAPSATAHQASNILPASFSPSHRRGGGSSSGGHQTYLPGGAAETVRNWVLDLTSSSSDTTAEAFKHTDTVIQAGVVSHDRSGRCILVTALADGEKWMLIGHPRQRQRGGSAVLTPDPHGDEEEEVKIGNLSDVQAGSFIAIKGGRGMRWEVDLPGEDGESDRFNVAVLWDVLEETPMKVE